jgi:hypothetical protein
MGSCLGYVSLGLLLHHWQAEQKRLYVSSQDKINKKKRFRILTDALGDMDFAGDLQKVPETTEFNIQNGALTA